MSKTRMRRVLILAILWECGGGINDNSGRATAKLFNLVNLNGANIKTNGGMNLIMRELEDMGALVATRNGKRTYRIAQTDQLGEYEDDVLALVDADTLIFSEPVVEEAKHEPVVEVPVVEQVVQPVATPDELAKAILDQVFEYYMKSQEPDPNAWRKLMEDNRETGRQKQCMQQLEERLNLSNTRLNAANTRISQLEAENVRLNANLQNAIRDEDHFIRDKAIVALSTIVGSAPGTVKGND